MKGYEVYVNEKGELIYEWPFDEEHEKIVGIWHIPEYESSNIYLRHLGFSFEVKKE